MVRTKKSMLFLGLLLVLSVFAVACGGEDTSTDPGSSDGDDGSQEAAEGGDLVIAWLSDAVTLDPHGSNDVPSSNVLNNIYDTLVTFDKNGELTPSLATDWNMIDDHTWEFNLREGVTFHDGSEFNAEVVKANMERIMDPDIASQRAFLYEMVEEVEVVDEHTVRFITEYPFAALPAHLSHSGGGSMISPKAIEEDYAAMEEGEEPGSVIGDNPVGTGIFKLDSWTPGDEIVLVRNEDFWGENAKLDSVTWKVVSESLARISELDTGYAHIIHPVSPSDITRVDSMAEAHLNAQTSTSLSYIGFNAEKAPFDDVRVRQAISMAINKDDIIDGIYEGTGVPAIGPIAPGVFGYDDTVTPIEYDIEKAKELLAEAGHEDGFSTTIWTNDNPDRIQMAEYVQDKLGDLNIEVEVEVLEWGAYLDSTANGQHDMFILGWSTPTADADYATYALFHSDNMGPAGNRTFLADEELDALLDQGRQESDPDARAQVYKEVQEKLVELAPMVYIHHQEYLNGVSDKVDGFWVDAGGIFQLQDVTLTETE
ncbi:glutathione ABC transporter substrate-binding protein [Caldalkalibacillus salinus]|uniref:glutathione ABC transporter substrate-binding protein n=1 Tax=Caldalkalibacillus salinus TaxID=2803787 RepID=UPI0019235DD9|nr:glutathione ABC transporter substrate-binding protein [Caldalkalibacillus salinus]